MPDLPDLIPLDEAQRRVLDGIEALPAEGVSLADAAGLVLASPVRSALTMPPWPNSAMDGFAVRSGDVAAASRAPRSSCGSSARCRPAAPRTRRSRRARRCGS